MRSLSLIRIVVLTIALIQLFAAPVSAQDLFWQERVVELRDPVQACTDASRLVNITYPVREPESAQRFQTDIQVLREYPETKEVAELLVSRLQKNMEIHQKLEEIKHAPPSEHRRLQNELNAIGNEGRKLIREIAEIMTRVEPMLRVLIENKIRAGSRVRRTEREERERIPLRQEKPKPDPIPVPVLPQPEDPRYNYCPLPKVPLRTPIQLPAMKSAKLWPKSLIYRKTFFEYYPEFIPFSKFVEIHHAIPQDVLNKHPNMFLLGEIHSINNLRGICVPWREYIHDEITASWNEFFKRRANLTRQQILDEADRIDEIYGGQFDPPIRH